MTWVPLKGCTENHKNKILDEISTAVFDIQRKYGVYGTITLEMSKPVVVKVDDKK